MHAMPCVFLGGLILIKHIKTTFTLSKNLTEDQSSQCAMQKKKKKNV